MINKHLLKELSIINCFITEIRNPSQKANLTYPYSKPMIQREGNCSVVPETGTSMYTNFTFNALNWLSSKSSLWYNFFYLTKNNLRIKISEGKSINNIVFSNQIPAGYNFFLEVTDSSGYNSITFCKVNVTENKNISLDQINIGIYNPIEKLQVK